MIHLKLQAVSVRFRVRLQKKFHSSLRLSSTMRKHERAKKRYPHKTKNLDTCFDRIRRFYPCSSNGRQLDVWWKKIDLVWEKRNKKRIKINIAGFNALSAISHTSVRVFWLRQMHSFFPCSNHTAGRDEEGHKEKVWRRISRQWTCEKPMQPLHGTALELVLSSICRLFLSVFFKLFSFPNNVHRCFYFTSRIVSIVHLLSVCSPIRKNISHLSQIVCCRWRIVRILFFFSVCVDYRTIYGILFENCFFLSALTSGIW